MQYIGLMLGFIGVFKYVVDRVVVDLFMQFKEVMGESLKQRGNLTTVDQQIIALDMVGRFWSKVTDSDSRKVTLFTKSSAFLASAYQYFVPGPVRSLLFVPTYIITYPVRMFIDRQKMDALREQTREIAIKGLWSCLIPLLFSIIVASLFVQEVEYVRVVNGQGPDGPEIKEHLIRRVVIGVGRFSLALPHHPVIYGVSYVLVLFSVFHTVSFFVILSKYENKA